MEILAGPDVSVASTSACAPGADGRIANGAKVPSDPGSPVEHMHGLPGSIAAVGLEAGPCQDGPAGCRGHRAAAADGMVPARALQAGRVPGDAGPAGLAQRARGRPDAAWTPGARHSPQLPPEARPGLERGLRGAGPGAGLGQRDAAGRRRADPAAARADARRAGRDDEEGRDPRRAGRHLPAARDLARNPARSRQDACLPAGTIDLEPAFNRAVADAVPPLRIQGPSLASAASRAASSSGASRTGRVSTS